MQSFGGAGSRCRGCMGRAKHPNRLIDGRGTAYTAQLQSHATAAAGRHLWSHLLSACPAAGPWLPRAHVAAAAVLVPARDRRGWPMATALQLVLAAAVSSCVFVLAASSSKTSPPPPPPPHGWPSPPPVPPAAPPPPPRPRDYWPTAGWRNSTPEAQVRALGRSPCGAGRS